jgi:hypothetical protein
MCIDICGNEHTSVSAAQNPSAPVDYGCCGCADPRVAHKTWIQSAGVIVLILSIVEFGIAGSASTHGRFGAWWVAIFTTFGALLGISMRFRGFAIASVVVSVFTLFASVVGTSVNLIRQSNLFDINQMLICVSAPWLMNRLTEVLLDSYRLLPLVQTLPMLPTSIATWSARATSHVPRHKHSIAKPKLW